MVFLCKQDLWNSRGINATINELMNIVILKIVIMYYTKQDWLNQTYGGKCDILRFEVSVCCLLFDDAMPVVWLITLAASGSDSGYPISLPLVYIGFSWYTCSPLILFWILRNSKYMISLFLDKEAGRFWILSNSE